MLTVPKTDLYVLALTAIGEARGEGAQGMEAVMDTVMNRTAKCTWYGLTPTEVCFKPWQYSCWNAEDPNRAYLERMQPTDPLLAGMLPTAQSVLDGSRADLTGGATHYYRAGTKPPVWAV